MINFEEFQKVDLRVGEIMGAERVEGSDKLIKLKVSFGSAAKENENVAGEAPSLEIRQIIAGIGKSYEPKDLISKKVIAVVNLEPRVLLGLESQGMLLAVGGADGLSLIVPEKEVAAGGKIS